MQTFVSDISKKTFPVSEKISGDALRPSIMNLIRVDHPQFGRNNSLSISELNLYREKYIYDYLKNEVGQLTELDTKVIESIKKDSVISDGQLYGTAEDKRTTGEKVADRVAAFGGSWTFIILFFVVLFLWIIFNALWLANKGFDPYPFILLNLVLSCLAAVQAPIIMMSQNRQSAIDRRRSKEDYMVNLKSELGVRALHEKLDHLMMYQQQELVEIQKIQVEMLNDIIERVEKHGRS